VSAGTYTAQKNQTLINRFTDRWKRDPVNIPMITIETQKWPVMLCGSAPFLGMNRFGFRAFDLRVKFYNHPDAMAELFTYFIDLGCKGVHILCYENIIAAAHMAYNGESFPLMASLLPKDIPAQLNRLSPFHTVCALIPPSLTDALDESYLHSVIRDIRDAGMVPGLVTHVPGTTIPALDKMNLDVAVYLAPINIRGTYMLPSKQSALKAIMHTDTPVIADNPLAAGKISAQEGIPFVMDQCSGFSLGVISKEEINEAYDVLMQTTERSPLTSVSNDTMR